MNDTAISIARVLLSKNIPFCLYRFPGSGKFNVAVEPYLLPHDKEKSFWVAPFSKISKAGDIFLSVLNSSSFSASFLQKIKELKLKELPDIPVPQETEKEIYLQEIAAYLSEMRLGTLKKAVLSRIVHLPKSQNFSSLGCFLNLSKHYPDTFTYLLLHPRSGIWLGATPELLIKKRETEITTMALAGTQSRRADSDYFWREKEMEEHHLVSAHIEQVFQNFNCTVLKKTGPEHIESASVAHLRTNYTFEEQRLLSLRQLLKALHPTPAVGGLPVKEALACIQKYENYDRHYYCGFIGETDFETTTDLYINLRCMQIGAEKIALYVGGGITASSDPEEEWRETFLKSKTMGDIIKLTEEQQKDGIIK